VYSPGGGGAKKPQSEEAASADAYGIVSRCNQRECSVAQWFRAFLSILPEYPSKCPLCKELQAQLRQPHSSDKARNVPIATLLNPASPIPA